MHGRNPNKTVPRPARRRTYVLRRFSGKFRANFVRTIGRDNLNGFTDDRPLCARCGTVRKMYSTEMFQLPLLPPLWVRGLFSEITNLRVWMGLTLAKGSGDQLLMIRVRRIGQWGMYKPYVLQGGCPTVIAFNHRRMERKMRKRCHPTIL